MFKKKEKQEPAGALKKKALVCSSEAAAISIGIHVLLVLFAGSIVAIKYVQKREAAFAGENIVRPKLERRQLQMPQKVQNLQKKSSRPTVSSRMATASQSSFSLPDMMGMGDIGGGFDRGGSGERTLSNMGAAGSLGFGIAGINFFGAKSKGEKVVFVIDAQKRMMEDKRGGYFTYKFAKDRLVGMINGMSSATLFNVMVYVRDSAAMFRPNLVPATPENRAALLEWITPLNSDPKKAGDISNMPGQFDVELFAEVEEPPVAKLYSWLRPVQAAMEQKADNIFVLCSGYDYLPMSNEMIMRKHNIDDVAEWRESRGWGPERVKEFYRKKEDLWAKAREELKRINREREENGQPPKIVAEHGFQRFIREELGWDFKDDLPALWNLEKGSVSADLLVEYLEEVYEYHYIPQKLDKPKIHMVKLIAAGTGGLDPDSNEGDVFNFTQLKRIPAKFRGELELLEGADTIEDLMGRNKGLSE